MKVRDPQITVICWASPTAWYRRTTLNIHHKSADKLLSFSPLLTKHWSTFCFGEHFLRLFPGTSVAGMFFSSEKQGNKWNKNQTRIKCADLCCSFSATHLLPKKRAEMPTAPCFRTLPLPVTACVNGNQSFLTGKMGHWSLFQICYEHKRDSSRQLALHEYLSPQWCLLYHSDPSPQRGSSWASRQLNLQDWTQFLYIIAPGTCSTFPQGEGLYYLSSTMLNPPFTPSFGRVQWSWF